MTISSLDLIVIVDIHLKKLVHGTILFDDDSLYRMQSI